MNITNPNAFWLLLLLIIPILIHLFQFRKYKKLKFSNVAFLKAINQEQKSSRRLKHLLILLSRMLFIIFLVMCIAKPFWPAGSSEAEVNLIILDKSASNTSFAEGRSNSILEENMNLINRLQEQFPENVQIIDETGTSLQPYDEVKMNAASASLPLNSLVTNIEDVNKVLILSDFQKQIIDENKAFLSDTSVQFLMMPPFSESPANLVWDSLWIANNIANTLEESLIVQLAAVEDPLPVNISLESNDNLTGTKQLDSREDLSDTSSFRLRSNAREKEQRFQIKSDDAIVTFDNTFYFNKVNFGKIKVILLEQGDRNQMISALFTGNEIFEFQSANINNYNFQNLDNFDLAVVLMDKTFNSYQAEALQAYAAMGNSLVLIPEADFTEPELLDNFGLKAAQKIASANQRISLQNPDMQNPFFENIFQKQQRNIDMPEAQPLLKWQSGQDLLSFVNGYPYLSRFGLGQNIYVFSAPIGKEYSDFSSHGLFLPVFYKIAFAGKSENTLSYHFLDEEVIKVVRQNVPSGTVLKLQQEKQVLIPDQRLQGSGINLILPEREMMAGFYQLKDAKSDSLFATLAFNYPKAESENGFYTAKELQQLFSASENVTVLENYELSTLENYLLESKTGFPLWKYFLILALLSLLAEILIIRLLK